MRQMKSIVDQLVDQSRGSVFDTPEPTVHQPSFDVPTPEGLGGVAIQLPELDKTTGQNVQQPAKSGGNSTPEPIKKKGNIEEIILAAANKHGVDPARLLALAYHETGGTLDPNAVNAKSGAKGLFQALPSWAKQYGVAGKEFEPEAVADAAARSLIGTKGTKTPYLSYLVHNQGRAGAEAILRAAAGEGELPAKIKRNMLAQPGFKGKAASDEDLAKAFLSQQKKSFMKHYDRAHKLYGEKDRDSQIVSRGSGGIDWDGLLQHATQQMQGEGSNMILSQLGPSVPRTTWGGKI